MSTNSSCKCFIASEALLEQVLKWYTVSNHPNFYGGTKFLVYTGFNYRTSAPLEFTRTVYMAHMCRHYVIFKRAKTQITWKKSLIFEENFIETCSMFDKGNKSFLVLDKHRFPFSRAMHCIWCIRTTTRRLIKPQLKKFSGVIFGGLASKTIQPRLLRPWIQRPGKAQFLYVYSILGYYNQKRKFLCIAQHVNKLLKADLPVLRLVTLCFR